jgi:hypothetical protein
LGDAIVGGAIGGIATGFGGAKVTVGCNEVGCNTTGDGWGWVTLATGCDNTGDGCECITLTGDGGVEAKGGGGANVTAGPDC